LQGQLIGAGIADMLRYVDADIGIGNSRQRQGAQHFQTGDKDMAAIGVLAHIGNLFHHVRHGAALGGAHAMAAMGTRNADNSH